MAYPTAEDLRHFIRRSSAFSDEETAQAELMIELAKGVIEDEAGQALESSTDTVTLDGPAREDREYHVGTGTRKLVLPRWPVTDVDAVTLHTADGDEVLAEGQDADYTWSQSGILTRIGGWWPHGDRAIEVTYTAGFVELPKGLKRIALRLAAGGWSNPSGLTAESIGDHSKQWAAETLGMELSARDRSLISAYAARTTW